MAHLINAHRSTETRYYNDGSNREILDGLLNYIDEHKLNISEIYLALYLYNNEILHNKMKELANLGINIKVISIPPEGYDNTHATDIFYRSTNELAHSNATKYSLAKLVYDDVINFNNPNYQLYIFGHIYVRSSKMKNFSRGRLPYSLHTKSIFIKMRDGRAVTVLSSCNLAVRDESKDEIMMFLDGDASVNRDSELFFNMLINNSTPVNDWKDPYPNFSYPMNCVEPFASERNFFVAPFLNNSPVIISEKLSNIAERATRRILIYGEHLAAYNYTDLHGKLTPGLFNTIFNKCSQGIPVYCLSQTYVDGNGDSHGQRSPKNKYMFKKLIQKIDTLQNCVYAVNPYVHAKFLIVDDTVVISSANFTPTEFLYGKVLIEQFDAPELKGVRYEGIFSEVEHYIIIEDHGIAEQLVSFFNDTLEQINTYIHNNRNNAENRRFYINCPYGEKDEAKRLGAKWDPDQKKWYYTSPEQEHLFERWL